MHEKDRFFIESIKKYFGEVGHISKPNKTLTTEFRISTLNDLVNVIIPHFDKYSLISKKRVDYLLLKKIKKNSYTYVK